MRLQLLLLSPPTRATHRLGSSVWQWRCDLCFTAVLFSPAQVWKKKWCSHKSNNRSVLHQQKTPRGSHCGHKYYSTSVKSCVSIDLNTFNWPIKRWTIVMWTFSGRSSTCFSGASFSVKIFQWVFKVESYFKGTKTNAPDNSITSARNSTIWLDYLLLQNKSRSSTFIIKPSARCGLIFSSSLCTMDVELVIAVLSYCSLWKIDASGRGVVTWEDWWHSHVCTLSAKQRFINRKQLL